MRTIAIINLKGGVAKTTSSINIAYILMRKGYKVLLVDNDKQGDCSRGMNRRTQDGEGIDRIMVERHPDMEKLINKTDYLHLDIITANLGLLTANLEVTMDRVRPQQNRLKKALQQVADNYDFCVIDNAPDINVSVINALTAADDVLIPVEVDDNTLEGMNELLDQIDDVKEELNPDLKNVRCFITKYQKFNQAHLQGAEIIEEQYPIMRTKIRFSGVVARSTFVRMPVALHSPRSAAAVKAFCGAYPEKLKTIMRICRLYNNNGEAARAVQKRIAPYGYHGCTGPEVGYTFMGLNAGLEIEIGKEKVSMKYGRLIAETKKLYDPWDAKFGEKECCQSAAETPDEKQQEHFVEGNKMSDHPGETTEMPDAWPQDLKDIPIPTETEIMGYLYDEERKLREILEVEKEEPGMPRMEIMRQQMLTAGLRLIKNLVKDCREE